MKRVLIFSGLALGAAAIAAPVIALPPGTNFNKSADSGDYCSDEETGSEYDLVFHYPARLWPPNHKYFEDIYVTATDHDGGEVTLETDGTHNQYAGGQETNGSGNTANDIDVHDDEEADIGEGDTASQPAYIESDSNSVRTDWKARAERSGHKSDAASQGREYKLHALATFGDGGSCEGTVTIVVPHDMSPANTGRTTGKS